MVIANTIFHVFTILPTFRFHWRRVGDVKSKAKFAEPVEAVNEKLIMYS